MWKTFPATTTLALPAPRASEPRPIAEFSGAEHDGPMAAVGRIRRLRPSFISSFSALHRPFAASRPGPLIAQLT